MKSRLLPLIGSVVIGAILVACGGGGGGSSGGSTSSSGASTSLSGTAAVGAPMAGATIYATDVNGKILSTTADSSGAYSFADISSLAAPILITATGNVGNNPQSFSSIITSVTAKSNNVANATPLTDVIVYQAAGQSPGNLLTNPSAMSSITPASVSASSANVSAVLANVMNGITPGAASGYSPISTPFIADGASAYDRIHDLMSVYPSSSVGSSAIAINIADKSGTLGTSTIAAGASVNSIAPLPALPSSIAALALSKLTAQFGTFNQLVSTTSGLNSSAFAAFFSDSFIDNGSNKTTFVNDARNPSSNSYFLGVTLSHPVINSCTTNGICEVNFLFTNASGSFSSVTISYIYDAGSGNWLAYGNQQPDLEDNFDTFAQLSTTSNQFRVGIDFNVKDQKNLYPYNSAQAVFKDKNGTIDATLYMKQKPTTCPTTSKTYYGLPFANTSNPTSKVADTLCNSWYFFDDETIIKQINSKILQGGYTIIVTAYTDNNWSISPVTKTIKVTKPLLTSDKINVSMFPKVTPSGGSSSPSLSIPNASDYTLIGSVCMSSNSQIGYCDMTNTPSYTSVYKPNNNTNLLAKYIPVIPWPAGQAVKTFFVHALDKYGRDLRVNN